MCFFSFTVKKKKEYKKRFFFSWSCLLCICRHEGRVHNDKTLTGGLFTFLCSPVAVLLNPTPDTLPHAPSDWWYGPAPTERSTQVKPVIIASPNSLHVPSYISYKDDKWETFPACDVNNVLLVNNQVSAYGDVQWNKVCICTMYIPSYITDSQMRVSVYVVSSAHG